MRLILFLTLVALPGIAQADLAEARKNARSKDFVATGMAQCAQEVGEALGPCEAKIARAGNAVVAVVAFPNGFARMLMFEDGAFLRGNSTMSGVGTDTEWHRSDGLYKIRVDDQRFDIPEALIVED